MGFAHTGELVDASLDRSWITSWRKSPTAGTTAGVWFDLSMSPGNPVPQYYAASPLVSVALTSTDGGLFHGSPVSPLKKHLRSATVLANAATALPMTMILCDYLLYYPFCDDSITGEAQFMTNSVSLPRWVSGAGVQVMAVSVAARTGGQTFSMTYTNSAGVTGRVSQTVLQSTAAANGTICNSTNVSARSCGPFIPLQDNDAGVQQIETVTMDGPDVGLFTLVLVKPLGQLQLRGIDAPVEVDYWTDFNQAPEIPDGAYLNFICNPRGALSSTTLHGLINVAWN